MARNGFTVFDPARLCDAATAGYLQSKSKRSVCRFIATKGKIANYSQTVMKTLFLMRHAKSSWDDQSLADFDRPLNKRGGRAAPFMGKLIKDKGFDPSVIVSSPAVRARQTAALVKEAGKLRGILHFEPLIYEASPNALRQVVAGLKDTYESALLVGHNPGIEGFIRYLTGYLEPMPTGALAIIELRAGSWSEINDGCGDLQIVVRPREEMDNI